MEDTTPVRIDRTQHVALQAIRQAQGVPIAEQVRRALAAWIASQAKRRRA